MPIKQGQQDTSGMLGATGTESNDALGTRLTAQALANSPAAGIPLNVPANVPLSPDLENRVHNQSTTAPAPSLMDRAKSAWNTLATKAGMAGTGLMHGGNPYWQAPVDANFYRPGRDAASTPFVGSGR